MDEQAKHLSYIVNQCLGSNVQTVEATAEAEDAWVQEIVKLARLGQQFQESCTPGYYNNEGKPKLRTVQNGPYGAGANAFFALIKGWREEGSMEGLELN